MGVLFATTPTFSAGWGGGELDGGRAARILCLQETCHGVGSRESKSTGHSRRSPTTSVTFGRRVGSCSQHLDAMSHNKSVRPSSRTSCGRGGRPPPTILRTVDGVLKLLNGYLPVKA